MKRVRRMTAAAILAVSLVAGGTSCTTPPPTGDEVARFVGGVIGLLYVGLLQTIFPNLCFAPCDPAPGQRPADAPAAPDPVPPAAQPVAAAA